MHINRKVLRFVEKIQMKNEQTNKMKWNENSREEKLILIMKCMSVGLVDGSKLKLLLLIKLNGCILDLNQPNGTTCCFLLQANEELKAQSLNSILTLSSHRMNNEWNWRRVYVIRYARSKWNKLKCSSLQTVSMGNWQSILLLSFDLSFYFHFVFLSSDLSRCHFVLALFQLLALPECTSYNVQLFAVYCIDSLVADTNIWNVI